MDSGLSWETTSASYFICSCFGKGAFQTLVLSLSSSACFICLKLYSSLSRRVFQGLPMKHYKSSSVPTHQWQASYTCDAFVQPSITGVFVGWAYRGLTDLQSTWENVWLKILFAVHINRVNTPRSPLWTKTKKKHDNEKVVLSFLFTWFRSDFRSSRADLKELPNPHFFSCS